MKKTLIKVCGITNIDDIKYASDIEDIDYLGIIFAKESSRCVDLDLAEKLINACDQKKNIVAVFMNQSKEDVSSIIKNLDFDILQFHGNESIDFCNFFNDISNHKSCIIWFCKKRFSRNTIINFIF